MNLSLWDKITGLNKSLLIRSREASAGIPKKKRNKIAAFRIKLFLNWAHPIRYYKLKKMQKRIKSLKKSLRRNNNYD